MPPFPWHSLKAETLRTICKELGASSITKGKRDDMVLFLRDVETLGRMCFLSPDLFWSRTIFPVSSALQGNDAAGPKAGSATSTEGSDEASDSDTNDSDTDGSRDGEVVL